MIHYHGSPLGPSIEAAKFMSGRHAMVSYAAPQELPIVADVCQSFVLDNGAFSIWRKGGKLDVPGYIRFCETWLQHPACEWALIPDVIDGDESDNDRLVRDWPHEWRHQGVPIWHLHEGLDRIKAILWAGWPRIALGSSGTYRTPGTPAWWNRMAEAMEVLCDSQGRPLAKIHGLRMLDTDIFTRLPLASADSTNAVVNSGSLSRFGMYKPPSAAVRAEVIAGRIEAHQSPATWAPNHQEAMAL